MATHFSDRRPVVTVNFSDGFDDFYTIESDISIEDLHLQTEEIDQLSLLNTVVTYIECNAEGMLEHSAKYMDRVTDLRKILEQVYDKEAMRFCGSDGC